MLWQRLWKHKKLNELMRTFQDMRVDKENPNSNKTANGKPRLSGSTLITAALTCVLIAFTILLIPTHSTAAIAAICSSLVTFPSFSSLLPSP